MSDKPTYLTGLIAFSILIVLGTLFASSSIALIKTFFLDQDLLFEGLVLLGLGFIALLLCVAIINITDVTKNQDKIKTGLINSKLDLEEMKTMLIRMNMTRPGTGINLFDFLNKNRSSSTADVSFTMVYDDEKKSQDITELEIEELEEMLTEAIASEDYDTAAQVRDELERRK